MDRNNTMTFLSHWEVKITSTEEILVILDLNTNEKWQEIKGKWSFKKEITEKTNHPQMAAYISKILAFWSFSLFTFIINHLRVAGGTQEFEWFNVDKNIRSFFILYTYILYLFIGPLMRIESLGFTMGYLKVQETIIKLRI